MKPLVTDQRIMTWLCLLPAKENISKGRKGVSLLLVLGIIVANLTVISSSSMYVIKYASVDLQETLVGLCQAIGVIPMTNSIVIAFVHRHKIPPIFEKLSEIYDKCMNLFQIKSVINLSQKKFDVAFHSFLVKYKDIFRYMAQANNNSKRLWNVYFKFIMNGFLIAIAIPSIVSILICWHRNGYFDKALVFHPYKFVLVLILKNELPMMVSDIK